MDIKNNTQKDTIHRPNTKDGNSLNNIIEVGSLTDEVLAVNDVPGYIIIGLLAGVIILVSVASLFGAYIITQKSGIETKIIHRDALLFDRKEYVLSDCKKTKF